MDAMVTFERWTNERTGEDRAEEQDVSRLRFARDREDLVRDAGLERAARGRPRGAPGEGGSATTLDRSDPVIHV
jgi:hypothetical protein